MTTALITACAVLHLPSGQDDEDDRTCLGHCPECHRAVFDNDDPVWTCPANLHPDNPHHWESDWPVTSVRQERHGVYSSCWDDFGGFCVDDIPLHGDCYGSTQITY